MEKLNVVAVDIAKAGFQVAVSEEPGRLARERRLSRAEFLTFFAQTPRSTVASTASGASVRYPEQDKSLFLTPFGVAGGGGSRG